VDLLPLSLFFFCFFFSFFLITTFVFRSKATLLWVLLVSETQWRRTKGFWSFYKEKLPKKNKKNKNQTPFDCFFHRGGAHRRIFRCAKGEKMRAKELKNFLFTEEELCDYWNKHMLKNVGKERREWAGGGDGRRCFAFCLLFFFFLFFS
jgi:hypothetical protein